MDSIIFSKFNLTYRRIDFSRENTPENIAYFHIYKSFVLIHLYKSIWDKKTGALYLQSTYNPKNKRIYILDKIYYDNLHYV